MTSRTHSPFAALVLAASCGGTPDPGPSYTLDVEPPATGGCIGVAGFEITVTVAGSVARRQTLLCPAPVLSEQDCRLPGAVSVEGIDPDALVDVEVNGFDGVRQLRLSGTAHLSSLRNPGKASVALRAAGMTEHPVMTLDRPTVFGSVDLGEVTGIEIRTVGNALLLSATIDAQVRPFFEVGEPGAVTLSEAPASGEDLSASLKIERGGKKTARIGVTPDPSQAYLEAVPY